MTISQTAYTKEHPKRSRTYLCTECCGTFGLDAFKKTPAAKAKPKRAAGERSKIVHYEETKGVPPLADTCIGIIAKHIEHVDQLGCLEDRTLEKVCKIICKNRRLTPETATLFYSAENTVLALYDCTSECNP